MESTYIRYFLAGIFVIFLASLVLSELLKRMPKPRPKPPRQTGFRTMHPPRQPGPQRGNWRR